MDMGGCLHARSLYHQRKKLGTRRAGDWVGPMDRFGRCGRRKVLPCWKSNPGRQVTMWLNYFGPCHITNAVWKGQLNNPHIQSIKTVLTMSSSFLRPHLSRPPRPIWTHSFSTPDAASFFPVKHLKWIIFFAAQIYFNDKKLVIVYRIL